MGSGAPTRLARLVCTCTSHSCQRQTGQLHFCDLTIKHCRCHQRMLGTSHQRMLGISIAAATPRNGSWLGQPWRKVVERELNQKSNDPEGVSEGHDNGNSGCHAVAAHVQRRGSVAVVRHHSYGTGLRHQARVQPERLCDSAPQLQLRPTNQP